MKIVSRFVPMLAAAAFTFAFNAANAQDVQSVSVRFPYPVTVGARTLPPGNYTISTVDSSSDAPIFLVRGTQANAIAFASARVETPTHQVVKDDVVIEVTGTKHVLSQVRLRDSDSVYQLMRAKK